MRLFVAIVPPAAVLAELLAAVDPLRAAGAGAALDQHAGMAPDTGLPRRSRGSGACRSSASGWNVPPAGIRRSGWRSRAAERFPRRPGLRCCGQASRPMTGPWPRSPPRSQPGRAAPARRRLMSAGGTVRTSRSPAAEAPADVSGLTQELAGFSGSAWVADSISPDAQLPDRRCAQVRGRRLVAAEPLRADRARSRCRPSAPRRRPARQKGTCRSATGCGQACGKSRCPRCR